MVVQAMSRKLHYWTTDGHGAPFTFYKKKLATISLNPK
jgi:hypothetical protein